MQRGRSSGGRADAARAGAAYADAARAAEARAGAARADAGEKGKGEGPHAPPPSSFIQVWCSRATAPRRQRGKEGTGRNKTRAKAHAAREGDGQHSNAPHPPPITERGTKENNKSEKLRINLSGS